MVNAFLTWLFGTLQILGPLNLSLMAASLVIMTIACWFICKKAGFSGSWALFQLIPGLNIASIVVFAFLSWPALHSPRIQTGKNADIQSEKKETP